MMARQNGFNRRQALGLALGSLAGAAVLSACSVPATAQTTSSPAELYLTIVTGRMIGKKGYPAFIPSDIVLPAHSTINVRIANFDDGTAALPDNSPLAKVTGTLGQVTAQALTMSNPNVPGAAQHYTDLVPKDVAHTFTVSDLKLNVPMPVSAIVTFSFQTGNPGTYQFECLAPCGDGPAGFSGPMADKGYMMGMMKVV